MKQRKLLVSLLSIGILFCLNSCYRVSTILFLESDAKDKPNLVYNPSFEPNPEGDQRMPLGWLLMGSSRDLREPITCDSTQSLIGTCALKIEKSDKHLMIISDAFRIDSQAGYYIKASAKSISERGPNLKLRFIAYSEAGTIRNTFRGRMRTGNSWRKTSISAGFLKQNARFGRILIIVPPTNEDTIWIDDIGCYQVHHFRID